MNFTIFHSQFFLSRYEFFNNKYTYALDGDIGWVLLIVDLKFELDKVFILFIEEVLEDFWDELADCLDLGGGWG